MPEWMTPLLWPVWCIPSFDSLSRMTIRALGARSSSARAVASPMIPPPTIATSYRFGMAGSIQSEGIEGGCDGRQVLRGADRRDQARASAGADGDGGGQRVLFVPHHESPAAPRGLPRREQGGVRAAARQQPAHARHRGGAVGGRD